MAKQDQDIINEDALLKESEGAQVTKQFCGDKDVMQGAKPCANCTCGLKEIVEGNQSKLVSEKGDLENGNVESSCGKCYLGDAFRCASCPYRGLPAFEKGDKVKLVDNQGSTQQEVPQERVGVAKKQEGTKVMLNTDDMDI